jgi:hypothetical protein
MFHTKFDACMYGISELIEVFRIQNVSDLDPDPKGFKIRGHDIIFGIFLVRHLCPCVVCRLSGSTVWEYARIKPRSQIHELKSLQFR